MNMLTDIQTDGIISMSSLNSIGQSVFELESGNENVDAQTGRQTSDTSS